MTANLSVYFRSYLGDTPLKMEDVGEDQHHNQKGVKLVQENQKKKIVNVLNKLRQ